MKLCGETFSVTLSSKFLFLPYWSSLFLEHWLITTGKDALNLIRLKSAQVGIHTTLILFTQLNNQLKFGKREIWHQLTLTKNFWKNTHADTLESRMLIAPMLGLPRLLISICHLKIKCSLILTKCFTTQLFSKCSYSSKFSTWLTLERLLKENWMFSPAFSTTKCSS